LKGKQQLIDHAAFKKALQENEPMWKLRDVVIALHADGIPKDDIIKSLEALRKEVNEEDEDNILDVMDLLGGFCSPHMYIE
jgi:hypothetical protein